MPDQQVIEPGTVITLADEVLTPDSSRFWPADEYATGSRWSMPFWVKAAPTSAAALVALMVMSS